MKPEALLGLSVPLLFALMLAVETRAPARLYEPVSGWRWLGGAFFISTIVVGALTPLLIPVAYLQGLSVLNLSNLGLWGVPAGLLVITFAGYWLHRAEHRFGWLWRATHQLHHSPVRVDMLGAYFAHPTEVLLKVGMSTLVASLVLGLSPLAAEIVSVVIATLSLFQHWNIHTPRWLGYVVQRPESHCVHHAIGDRGHNFSELPLWDMLFGSFHNPPAFHGAVGLDAPTQPRVIDMLLMRSAPK